jgi:hypothetical protein
MFIITPASTSTVKGVMTTLAEKAKYKKTKTKKTIILRHMIQVKLHDKLESIIFHSMSLFMHCLYQLSFGLVFFATCPYQDYDKQLRIVSMLYGVCTCTMCSL